ncbi:UbiA family prenyltransferase [Nitrospira sp. KM1]|uniref:UbiA family prenyltransferase n=1 Tax=Nitrospira sp. KM1 TaxID=1936990 RepID=UPI0018D616F5|nr:UbiA family prenyltransferase [Nitrospira sp. KM1]
MMLGVPIAVFSNPDLVTWESVAPVAIGLVATCLVASSNYVINELLDGPRDRLHPEKCNRPVPRGLVRSDLAYIEWITLGLLGMWLAWKVNGPFAVVAASLWVMGVLYNVPPMRTKEWPYLDVLSESINNPLRLLLGWFALIPDRLPPASLLLAYWMVGAFFMAVKRYAEYRHIGDKGAAAAYRESFAYYTEERLLLSLFFYAAASALFGGVFMIRYHIELILFVPLAAGMLTFYLKIGLRPNSPVQHPERLYREIPFMVYLTVCMGIFVVLLFTRIPALHNWFGAEPAVLWTLDEKE